jgi:hypothetical protein
MVSDLIFIEIKKISFFSEACKKFFLRSVNEEYLKYKCIRDKKCLITRTTRTQCQFCRYRKCIEVGMKITGKFSEFIFDYLIRKLFFRRKCKSKN